MIRVIFKYIFSLIFYLVLLTQKDELKGMGKMWMFYLWTTLVLIDLIGELVLMIPMLMAGAIRYDKANKLGCRPEDVDSKAVKACMILKAICMICWWVAFFLFFRTQITIYGNDHTSSLYSTGTATETSVGKRYSGDEDLADAYYGGSSVSGTTKRVEITAKNAANIRKGPGTEYDIVTTLPRGSSFVATGRTAKAKNGGLWYELYIQGGLETAWVSEQVSRLKDE